MSDGISDIYREEMRQAVVSRYYDGLLAWLKDQTLENAEKVKALAKAADEVRQDWQKKTSVTKTATQRMELLVADDEDAWLRLIAEMEPWYAKSFLEISPFRYRTLILYKYGSVKSVHLGGRECRAFKWEWNDDKWHIGDNGKWVACN